MAYLMKIKLKGVSKPPVWRKLTVPHDLTFEMLHAAIQVSFGWRNEHMYEFCDSISKKTFEIKPLFEEDEWMYDMAKERGVEVIEAAETKLCNVFKDDRKSLIYHYDFGDDWIHHITIEDFMIGNEQHAVCLSGKGACPPEDCGGPGGYEYMKETLNERPCSKDAREIRKWLGLGRDEKLHPDDFTKEDVESINKILENIDNYFIK